MWLCLLLFMLGLAFLLAQDQDGRAQLQAFRQQQLQRVAFSALDYFTFLEIESPGSFVANEISGPYPVGPDAFFTITADGSGGCTLRAWLVDDGGRTVAQKILVLPAHHLNPGGDRLAVYEL